MSTTPADQPEPTLPDDEHAVPSSSADGIAAGATPDGDASDASIAAVADDAPDPGRAADADDDEGPATLTAYPDPAHPVVLDRSTLRRAPRFGRFALVAVLGGLLLGVVLGHVIFPASHPGWSRTIFAFEVMLVVLAVTLVAALASDARSRRRLRR